MNDKLSVGIVVIGRNEGERLRKCLLSVLKSGVPIVYVDSCSSDGSVDLAESLGVDVVVLDGDKAINAAVARNAGFARMIANNVAVEFIHFIDADCEMDGGWLTKAVDALKANPDVATVCGRLREKDINLSIYTRLCDMGWYIAPGEIDSCGGIVTLRKSVFMHLNGFNERLIAGEEPEFYSRIRKSGHKMLCLEAEMGTHDSAMTSLAQWYIRATRTGFAYADGAANGRWKAKQKSIVVWGALIPFLIIALGIFNSLLFSLVLIYPLQMLRVAYHLAIPYDFSSKLLEGCFCVLVKFPHLIGVFKYHLSRLSSGSNDLIEYK